MAAVILGPLILIYRRERIVALAELAEFFRLNLLTFKIWAPRINHVSRLHFLNFLLTIELDR